MRVTVMNLPNKLSMFRIVLVPVIACIYLFTDLPEAFGADVSGEHIAVSMTALLVLILFAIASFTDYLDGYIARKHNLITSFGKFIDPIADKLLTCGAMIVCSAFGELAWWVTVLFLIREIGITVMRFFVMERPGGKVIAAAWPGKLKTVFECVGLAMLLLPMWSLGGGQSTPFWMTAYYFLTYAIIYVALVLCLYSGVIYLYNTFVGTKKQ